MFEHVTNGMAVIGAEELYLGGANVVIGLADEQGNLVGYFGRAYHPNRRMPIDQVGAEEPPIGRPRIAIGLAVGDDETVIGWFGSSFLKSVGKAITTPVKAAAQLTIAPVKATVNIAKGKPVGKSLSTAFVKPVVATAKSQLAVAKPVAKVAAPVLKSPITKAVAGGLAIAFPPIGLPVAAGVAAGNVALSVHGKVTAGTKLAASLVPKSAPKPAAKPAPKPAAKPRPMTAAEQAAYSRAMAGAQTAASAASRATANKAAADAAKKKAALALATADKVLASAKGTLPSQKLAPAPVAKALQTAAKKTVAATYAAAKLGDQDAARGVAALAVANRLQKVVPATRNNIHPVVAPVAGATYNAVHVDKKGTRTRGMFKASAAAGGSGNAAGVIVLRDGTPIEGSFAKVG